MKNHFIKHHGFTLMEMIVVVVIIGIIAGFAIPNYNKVIYRSRYRNARLNLITIHSGLQIYKAKHGTSAPGAQPLSAINNTLGLAIPNDDCFAYSYFNSEPPMVLARNWRPVSQRCGRSYTLMVSPDEPISDTNPRCITNCGNVP